MQHRNPLTLQPATSFAVVFAIFRADLDRVDSRRRSEFSSCAPTVKDLPSPEKVPDPSSPCFGQDSSLVSSCIRLILGVNFSAIATHSRLDNCQGIKV